jgi:hypothetical protein
MGDYRAYILGIEGHRFVWVADFSSDHPDDAAALNAAKLLTDEHEVEVWDGGRFGRSIVVRRGRNAACTGSVVPT